MKVVKIADAKNNLSRHLDYVRRGGRIRILDRNTPVADLVPVAGASAQDDDDLLLDALERDGVLRRGTRGPLPGALLRRGPGGPRAGVVAALLEERERSR